MITIISGTNRSDSYSLRVAKTVSMILDKKEIPHRVFSLEELPRHFAFTKINDQEDLEFDQIVEDNIIRSEKFIFIVAEYNGGFPGILKTFIDSVHPKHFKTKKAALVGVASGRGGALRPLDHLTGVLHYLQVEVLSDKPKFTDIENCFDENDEMKDMSGMKRLNDMCDKFLKF
jgi:NAD(P)H-dependent FMN reductase